MQREQLFVRCDQAALKISGFRKPAPAEIFVDRFDCRLLITRQQAYLRLRCASSRGCIGARLRDSGQTVGPFLPSGRGICHRGSGLSGIVRKDERISQPGADVAREVRGAAFAGGPLKGSCASLPISIRSIAHKPQLSSIRFGDTLSRRICLGPCRVSHEPQNARSGRDHAHYEKQQWKQGAAESGLESHDAIWGFPRGQRACAHRPG